MHNPQSDVSPRPNPVALEQLAKMVELAARGEGNPPLLGTIQLPAHLQPTVAPDEASYDICGRRRSPATLRSFRLGQAPANKGKKYPATPPTEGEVLRMLGTWKRNPSGMRGRATMALQFRSGLRIFEALSLERQDINLNDGTVFVRCGKGGKSRLVGMDQWGFDQVMPWLEYRYDRYPPGPIFCVVQGPTKGQQWSTAAARTAYHQIAALTGIERRVAPHQMRHALACSMARENVPIHVISRQLGHSNVGTTATYLAGISNDEVVSAVHQRPAPRLDLVA